MLEIEQLTKTYDDFVAVENLSLAAGPGEIVGLVGPNGAGKTTTLRCIAGIIPPTRGTVRLAGQDLLTHPVEARRQLAFVSDEPHLFDYLTAWDHIQLTSRLYNVTDGHARGAELLALFGLADRRTSFPSELSRGMKQKLMITCALLHRPQVMILDEPLTGLDPRAMRQMKDVILQGARDGMTVLVSSHMLQLVEELCQRVAIIHRGRKVADGSLAEIRASRPELGASVALEEIFLRATEDADAS